MRGDLALAGIDGDAGRLPHARHLRGIVVPVARLLEPGDVERLDQAGEADGVLRGPAAIGVDAQHEVGPGGLARRRDALGIRLGRQSADLELATGHARRPVHLHLAADIGERLALAVVAADRDDRHRRRRKPPSSACTLLPAALPSTSQTAQSTQAMASSSTLRSRLGIVRANIAANTLSLSRMLMPLTSGASSSRIDAHDLAAPARGCRRCRPR